jgi:hypothetical protein
MTTQAAEYLLYKGEDLAMFGTPLDVYLSSSSGHLETLAFPCGRTTGEC